MIPPAIAPAGVECLAGVALGFFVQIVEAQELQDDAIRVHVSSEAHDGHAGVVGGHSMQRRKR